MVKNIIFDLGGVIIDLAFPRMVAGFDKLGVKHFENYFNPRTQQSFFEQLERGVISDEVFYENFQSTIAPHLTTSQIESAWNLILTDFIPERMALLEKLAQTHKLYLFSNTNAIHTRCFEARCRAQTGQPLSHYFTALFYSQNLHLRKPDPAAFHKVLELSALTASDTLFIDDTLDNITGAASVGLQTYHLTADQTILDINWRKL